MSCAKLLHELNELLGIWANDVHSMSIFCNAPFSPSCGWVLVYLQLAAKHNTCHLPGRPHCVHEPWRHLLRHQVSPHRTELCPKRGRCNCMHL